MTEIITRDVSSGTVKELVEKLIPDSIADSILKRSRSIYPMQEVHTRKVKVLKMSAQATCKQYIDNLDQSK